MQVARAIVFDIRNAEANNPNFNFSAEVNIFKYVVFHIYLHLGLSELFDD